MALPFVGVGPGGAWGGGIKTHCEIVPVEVVYFALLQVDGGLVAP